MRLPADYVDAIKTAAVAAFGGSSVVRLFGSRVNDAARGGDIDLHIETDPLADEHAARDRFENELFCRIERQKIDVVITERGRVPRGFERIAYRDGISPMTSGETDLVAAILARLELLSIALDEDSGDLGMLPTDMKAYGALTRSQRVASRALLKSVEQTEDQLARLFRLLPALKIIDTTGWFAQDYANFAEKIGILEDSFAWTAIIKLRNRLVHDYPLEPEAQLEMLTKAYNAVPLLQTAARAARTYIENGASNGD